MQRTTILSLLILASFSFGACSATKKTSQQTEVKSNAAHEAPIAPQGEEASIKPVLSEADKTEKQIQWLTLEQAYELNQQAPRKIFVDVYTNWCGWCKKMDKETFANAAVAEYVNNNYYAVKLDAESTREFELAGEKMTERVVARQLGATSFPTIILIHEDFQKFQPVPGYRAAKEFKEILAKFNAININQKP